MGTIDDFDDMKNSECILWSDLVRRWGKRDFELVKYLQKGLQPYSENGYPFDCPRAHHTYRRLSNEHHRLVAPLGRDQIQYNKNEILPSDSEKGYVISPEEEKILKEMKRVEKADSALSSWKYFESPELEVDLDEVLKDLRETLFKKEDVQAFEESYDLGPRKLSRSEKVRRKVRQLGREHLHENAMVRKAYTIEQAKILGITRKPGSKPSEKKFYNRRTVRNWLNDLPYKHSRRVRLRSEK